MVQFILISVLEGAPSQWRVEERPLAPPGWGAANVALLPDDALAVLATRDDAEGVFVVRPGRSPELVTTFPPGSRLLVGSARTLSVQVELGELFALALVPRLAFVSLGRFDSQTIRDVSCDLAAQHCVLATDEGAALWERGTLTQLKTSEMVQVPRHVVMHPRGTHLALFAEANVELHDLKRDHWLAFDLRLGLGPSAREDDEEVYEPCAARPGDWQGSRLQVSLEDDGEVPCQARPRRYLLSLESGHRRALRSQRSPWTAYSCPEGGQRSSGGGLTGPPQPVGFMLSDTEAFVLERAPERACRWFPGALRGGGRPFTVRGPSVIALAKGGVTVTPVEWRYGDGELGLTWGEAWHVFRPLSGAGLVLLRFVRVTRSAAASE